MSSRCPLTPQNTEITCSATVIGEYWFCFKSSVNFEPLLSNFWVDASRSEPNCANAAISRYWASSNFIEPDTFFMAFVWAEDPTLDTDNPTLIAGLIPWLKSSVSRNICPSVIEITFVGINAETSPPWVSIIGRAVKDPPPCSSPSFAALSSNLLCK